MGVGGMMSPYINNVRVLAGGVQWLKHGQFVLSGRRVSWEKFALHQRKSGDVMLGPFRE